MKINQLPPAKARYPVSAEKWAREAATPAWPLRCQNEEAR